MDRDRLEKTALRWRRTKIVATLGPASSEPRIIEQLLKAGVDMVRLNMSHGDHDSHRAMVKKIREAAGKLRKHVPIMFDLCGPRIRVGRFANGKLDLKTGSKVIVTSRQVTGSNGVIPSQYRRLHKDVKKGERILLNDGRLELKVIRIDAQDVHCKVIHGGPLADHKGMNLPDSCLTIPAFTEKDKRDADLAIEMGADFVALSFVRDHKDVNRLARYLQKQNADIPIISKIERAEAIENLDNILSSSYGIMVARGDLGIELPAEQVPLIQQDLVQRARMHNVPVIVATQMLESMVTESQPTRAEVGDVANAARLSTDAVMLSGETASGQHPLLAVQTMDRILREIESHQWRQGSFVDEQVHDGEENDITATRSAVAHATVSLARQLNMQAIVVPTLSGTTTRIIAAHRTTAPSIGVCANPAICRRMALHWGVVPLQVDEPDTHNWQHLCGVVIDSLDLPRNAHHMLVVAGFSDIPELNMPVLKIVWI
jgi:pyruvate kinase